MEGNLFQKSVSEVRENSKFDGGTYTLRSKSGDRKSLIDDGRWLSLDRRGKTSKVKQSASVTSSSAVASEQVAKTTESAVSDTKSKIPRSVSRSPSRAKSQERAKSSDKEEQDARAFWVSIDSKESQEQSRKASSVSRKVSQEKSSKKISRQSAERKVSNEPAVDYNDEVKKSKNSQIKRGSQVTKKRKESVGRSETKETSQSQSQAQEKFNRQDTYTVSNDDYNRGTNYPLVKQNEFGSDTLKKNSSSLSRKRGSIYDENINRDGFGREINNAVATRARNGSSGGDESKHFLSLQLFNKVTRRLLGG